MSWKVNFKLNIGFIICANYLKTRSYTPNSSRESPTYAGTIPEATLDCVFILYLFIVYLERNFYIAKKSKSF